MLHLEGIPRAGADGLSDPMSMQRSPLEGLENHQVERSVQQINTIHWQIVYHSVSANGMVIKPTETPRGALRVHRFARVG